MSAITVGGRAAGSWIFRPRLAMAPSSASSRRMRFSSTRSAFFSPNSRAISRVPILPGFARIKATMASRLGKPLSCFLFTYPRALPALFFAGVFGAAAGFAADVLAADATGARALLTASDFGFAVAFFAAAFLVGFGVSGSAVLSAAAFLAAAFFGAAFLAPRFGLPPPLAARSSISAMASASVIVSGVLSLGIVALTPPAVT